MSKVVTELLIHKPQNVALAMLDYFKWRQAGSKKVEDLAAVFKLKKGAEKNDR